MFEVGVVVPTVLLSAPFWVSRMAGTFLRTQLFSVGVPPLLSLLNCFPPAHSYLPDARRTPTVRIDDRLTPGGREPFSCTYALTAVTFALRSSMSKSWLVIT